MPKESPEAALIAAREELIRRVDAIDIALEALGSTDGASIPQLQRRVAVGDDKVSAVKDYLKKVKRARQSDIVQATGFNSGTVSTALHALQLAGEAEPGPKENRSRVWEDKS